MTEDERFMRAALALAQQAADEGEVPGRRRGGAERGDYCRRTQPP